jgi:uncharacterized protein YndB with AHSA1/START domain
MPVTSVTTDADALTLTLVADFPAGVDRLWDAFTDARKLERFWGPPGYPATFAEFDLRPGGHAHYWMTSPEGERFHGRWDVTAVDAPRSYSVIDAFADADGVANDDLPSGTMTITVEATASGSRVTAFSTFATTESLRQQLEMGMVEGLTQGFGQLDVVLADLRETALGVGTRTELVDDIHVRITRAFEAPRHLLWRAHTEPELMRRWLLGPDGWEMTVCENDLRVGGSYRNAWAPVGGTPGEPFGFDGENLVIEPERRIVTTERMTGAPFPANVNDLTFDEEDGVTLMTLLITYPDIAQRDAVLGTGMTDGMEASYARMERELLSSAATA